MLETSTTAVTPTLPTDDELRAVLFAESVYPGGDEPTGIRDLMDVTERVGEILRAVLAVTNHPGPVNVTLADIGALAAFVRSTRHLLEPISEELEKIEKSFDDLLERVRGGGEAASTPQYDVHGGSTYPH